MSAPLRALALDLGSTAVKAGALGPDGDIRHLVSHPAPAIAVHGEHRESDPLAYARTAETALRECAATAGITFPTLIPLGLCSQRSSFVIWQRQNGQPVTPLISWQDRRGLRACDALIQSESRIRQLAGIGLTPYYFGPKLAVILQDHPAWRQGLACGDLLVGTLDTFLLWRWSGGRHYATDVSMAARTLLMDLHTRQWSTELCDLFGIPGAALPEIRASAAMDADLDWGITVRSSLGDQSAALLASVGDFSGHALVNLGTGGFVIRPMDAAPPAGYLHTLLYQDSAGQCRLAAEGTLNSIATALAPYPVAELDAEALGRDTHFCLSEPSGLGAPYFRSDLRLGFSAPVTDLPPARIGALLIEGIVFRLARILEDFDAVRPLERAYLSGGLSELPAIRQGLAQCLTFDLARLLQRESSLAGAGALAAGIPARRPVAMALIEPDATHASLLRAKYRTWKCWLDDLLARSPGSAAPYTMPLAHIATDIASLSNPAPNT